MIAIQEQRLKDCVILIEYRFHSQIDLRTKTAEHKELKHEPQRDIIIIVTRNTLNLNI